MEGLGATYGTGEPAPATGVYELVGHEIPAGARCLVQRRVGGKLVEGYAEAAGGVIEVLRHAPLPSHGRCGHGALWCLISTGGWRYLPRRSGAGRMTAADVDAARRLPHARAA